MFVMSVKIENHFNRVEQSAERAKVQVLTTAADAVANNARASITISNNPSAPGQPPHSRGASGHNLPESIQVDVGKDTALIGPAASVVGEIGHVMEFGGEFRGKEYPAREFMSPALDFSLETFHRSLSGSIGG